MKYEGVQKLIIEGGNVELGIGPELTDAVDAPGGSAEQVVHDEDRDTLTLRDLDGRVDLPAAASIEIEIRSGAVRGEVRSGRLSVGDVDVAIAGGPPIPLGLGPKTVDAVSRWGLDLLGVLGFSVFYWIVFAVPSKLFNYNPTDFWSLQFVLGAGTYYGYTGRPFVSSVIALLAIFAKIQGREIEAEALSQKVKTVDVVKLGLYLAIMAAGKVLRDYIDSFRREGWIGLKNRWRR